MEWDQPAYAAFRDQRLRPALDLLARVADLPAGDVFDLGCGDGAVAAALAARFPDRRLIGVDASAAMLAKATGYHRTIKADIADWRPEGPPALIYSNAALHWLGDHATLMPRLAGLLAPGGTLAVQMPDQHDAPSHALLRQIAAALWPDRFDLAGWQPPVAEPAAYLRWLDPLGAVSLWRTEYLQQLSPSADGHPVRDFTASTAMRPVLDRLSDDEADLLRARYDAALALAYPLQPDGSVLFPFRRLFFVLRRADAPRQET